MSIEIRQAVPTDAPHIFSIKQAVWPSETSEDQAVSYIADIIALPNHAIRLAFIENVPVGFIDGFMTHTLDGLPRWEVDLLAVHPNFRGRAVAAHLVALSGESGRIRGAKFARGLVEINNTASQQVFAKCGYDLDDQIHVLYVGPGRLTDGLVPNPENTLLTPVQTINYRGIWIEGDYNKAGFLAGQALCNEHRWDLAGAVIPTNHIIGVQTAQELGFTLVGHYQWWKRGLA
ncbi:MAG: GNAT family N-acetyltransferase [Chloroflexi bacterium]|nr:GNAT family N-acetyltransferase [Chloroflexota bacterium]